MSFYYYGLEKDEITEMEVFYTTIQFQGFSAKHVAKILLERAERHGRNLEKDLSKMLMMVSTRGTRLDRAKVTASMDALGREFINDMKKFYDIRTETPKNRDEVTWARISSTFAAFELKLRAKYIDKVRITGDIHASMRAYAFPAAASIFPMDERYANQWKLFLDWAESFDNVIHKDNWSEKRRNVPPDPKKAREFAEMIRKNSEVPENVRVALAQTYMA